VIIKNWGFTILLLGAVIWMIFSGVSCKKTEEPLQPRVYDLPDDYMGWEDDFPDDPDTGESKSEE
jgi:hypothetical protein